MEEQPDNTDLQLQGLLLRNLATVCYDFAFVVAVLLSCIPEAVGCVLFLERVLCAGINSKPPDIILCAVKAGSAVGPKPAP